ncbi:Potassium uptake protein, integral membrane component, KtrB [Lachnospiraceae bacterium TWA4]|nr:Potassium uptake protein, integral membrane component, KtrB [Lachnospiraceae bacterium TWA4]
MKENNKLKIFSSTRLIALGFLGIIFLGALVLMLPISSSTHQVTNFADALFTATTSVCVTGLVTVPTYAHWSLFGKLVILCLIQIGGLGVVTVTMTFFLILRKRITMKNRILIQESYNLNSLKGVVRLIYRILGATVLIEGLGAIGYSLYFIPQFGVIKGIFYSIFHSISAFCNAGIDVIGPSSFEPFVVNPWINLVTMMLIVTGGIGFTVLWDIYENKCKFYKLEFHSKIAIITTSCLIFGGTICFFILEFNNSKTMGNLGLTGKIIASFFQSITTRTAGFASINQADLTKASALITMFLMFIGGSPAGTAGGMKTTTFATLVLTVRSMIKGRSKTEAFGRHIPEVSVRTTLAVFSLGFTILFGGMLVLCVTEDAEFGVILFESVSAIGTAGLSAGLCSNLSIVGKFVLIFMMYVGRIGPITVVVALLKRQKNTRSLIEFPSGKIIIG